MNNNNISTARQVPDDVAKALHEAYGLTQSDPSEYHLPNIIINGNTYVPDEAEVFSSGNNTIVLTFKDKIDSSFWYAIKGTYISSTFTETLRIQQNFNLDSNGDGSIGITNITNGLSFIQNFAGGRPVVSTTPPPVSSAFGFCQREGSETFNQCFNREVNEFCNDWLGTVAFITNPDIGLLIATACTC